MAQQPDNTDQAKGFSGLGSMVSDISKDVEHASRSAQSRLEGAAKQETDQPAVAATNSRPVDTPSAQSPHGPIQSQGAAGSPGSSGPGWVFGVGVVIIFLLWLIGSSGKKESPTYNPPPVASTAPPVIPSPIPAPPPAPLIAPIAPQISYGIGEKPPIGEGHVLNREQIRYCLSEKIRLDAIEAVLNSYRSAEVDKFNVLVTDYNSRCGRFRYQRGSLESVRGEVEVRRSEIEQNAQRAWIRESAGVSTTPDIHGGAQYGKAQQKDSTSNSQSSPGSQQIASPGLAPTPRIETNYDQGNQSNRPDISSLPESERSAIERKCSYDRQYRGLAEYLSCVGEEKRKLAAIPSKPDLSGLPEGERSAIERKCNYDRQYRGPADYYSCVGEEKRKLAAAPSKPDLTDLSEGERSAIERKCNYDRQYRGPAEYYSCVSEEKRRLVAAPGKPDLSDLPEGERSAIERKCNYDRQYRGPAEYYSCVSEEKRKLAAVPTRPDLSGLSESERNAIERKCNYDRQYRGPAEYYSCVGKEARNVGR